MAHSYAYLDNTGILHLHPLESEAAKHGKYVGTNLEHDESGFPIIGGEGVVYYVHTDEAYINGNKNDGQPIATPSPLRELTEQIK